MSYRRRAPPAGDFDQRIRLQERAAGVDALREPTGSWNTVTEVWAKARPLTTREAMAASQMQAQADIVFEIRYGLTIDPTKQRILWLDGSAAGVPCEIVGNPMQPSGARTALEIHCITGARDGR